MTRAAWVVALCSCALATRASARELASSGDGTRSLNLVSALKSTLLLSRAPNDPLLYPERTRADNLWRLRFTLDAAFSDRVSAEVAYEPRVQLSNAAGAVAGASTILPEQTAAPYRLAQLDWGFEGQRLLVHHEIDRAFVDFHPEFGEVKIGRQAIGYGRGVLFSAVDIFAPFSPLEVDREWRRGVDAVHVEARLGEHASIDATGGFDRKPQRSAAVLRARGYLGDVDGALMVGYRARDLMLALTSSATVGEAVVYGEAAVFDTHGDGVDRGLFGDRDWVAKAVLGASYSVTLAGRQLLLNLEYHHSGFGLHDVKNAATLLVQPAFATRFARGDTQILGQHAVALLLTYDVFSDLSATWTTIVSPVDGSGLLSPGLRWTASDRITLLASGFGAFGARPRGALVQSEWGLVPWSALIQLALYD